MTEREKLVEILGDMPGIAWSPSVRGIIADHLLANGVTIQEWIPVTERLPELGIPVLAYNGNDTFVSEYYRTRILPGDEGYMTWVKDQYACYPTHWMPLAEPPKEMEK